MNTNKRFFLGFLLLLAVVFIIVTVIRVSNSRSNTPENPPAIQLNALGDTDNLVSISVAPGSVLSGEHTIAGVLKGAYFFEANARGSLIASDGISYLDFPITATSDWMTEGPISFTAQISAVGMPKGPGYLRIANDNASGLPEFDRHIDIPVIYQ